MEGAVTVCGNVGRLIAHITFPSSTGIFWSLIKVYFKRLWKMQITISFMAFKRIPLTKRNQFFFFYHKKA